jgi:hypothetical protein
MKSDSVTSEMQQGPRRRFVSCVFCGCRSACASHHHRLRTAMTRCQIAIALRIQKREERIARQPKSYLFRHSHSLPLLVVHISSATHHSSKSSLKPTITLIQQRRRRHQRPSRLSRFSSMSIPSNNNLNVDPPLSAAEITSSSGRKKLQVSPRSIESKIRRITRG